VRQEANGPLRGEEERRRRGTCSIISIDLVFDGLTVRAARARRSVSVSADGSFRRRKPVVTALKPPRRTSSRQGVRSDAKKRASHDFFRKRFAFSLQLLHNYCRLTFFLETGTTGPETRYVVVVLVVPDAISRRLPQR